MLLNTCRNQMVRICSHPLASPWQSRVAVSIQQYGHLTYGLYGMPTVGLRNVNITDFLVDRAIHQSSKDPVTFDCRSRVWLLSYPGDDQGGPQRRFHRAALLPQRHERRRECKLAAGGHPATQLWQRLCESSAPVEGHDVSTQGKD